MLHAPDVPERSPAEAFVAPPGDIFLDPALAVPYALHEKSWGVDACEKASRVARIALSDELETNPTGSIKKHELQEIVGAQQDLHSLCAYEAEELAWQLLQKLPTGQFTIGQHHYVVAPGPWQQRWLSRYEDDGTLYMFHRFDKTEPGVRSTGFVHHIGLIRDIIRERIRVGAGLVRAPESLPDPTLFQEHPTSKNKLPLISNDMANTSLSFYRNHSDLLPGGNGILVQGNWAELKQDAKELAEEIDKAPTVTLFFDARKYIADQNMRVNDKGEHYDGPGDFTWQLVTSSTGSRMVHTLRIAGSRVLPMPTIELFANGDVKSMHQPDVNELTHLWDVIGGLLNSEQLRQRVESMRNANAHVALPTPEQRTKDFLQRLGRPDLFEEVPFVPGDPRKSNRNSQGGFKGNLVDVEAIVARQDSIVAAVEERSRLPRQLSLEFPFKR